MYWSEDQNLGFLLVMARFWKEFLIAKAICMGSRGVNS